MISGGPSRFGSALFSTQVRLVFDSGALTHEHFFPPPPHSLEAQGFWTKRPSCLLGYLLITMTSLILLVSLTIALTDKIADLTCKSSLGAMLWSKRYAAMTQHIAAHCSTLQHLLSKCLFPSQSQGGQHHCTGSYG